MLTDQDIINQLRSGKSYRQIKGVGWRRIKRLRNQLSAVEIHDTHSLESKITALQDENKALRTKLKGAQRDTALFEVLVDELGDRITPISPPVRRKPGLTTAEITEACVMHLSDQHADLVVQPEQVNGLERYDFNVALARAENYVDTVVRFTQETLSNYSFPDLYVLAYGDFVHGEIHDADLHTHYRNTFKSCLAVGQMHAIMFHDLCHYFERVHVLYLPGNHGRRRDRRKDYHAPHDNFDYLVAQIAKIHCQYIPNVNFIIPNAYSAVLNIEGWNFNIQHGDDVKSWNGIPWYGVERKTRRLDAISCVQGNRVHYHVFGHFHQPSNVSALDGETLINGAWFATEPWAYHAITGYNKPSQWLHGVHNKHGISWRLKVELQGKDKPDRYKVKL